MCPLTNSLSHRLCVRTTVLPTTRVIICVLIVILSLVVYSLPMHPHRNSLCLHTDPDCVRTYRSSLFIWPDHITVYVSPCQVPSLPTPFYSVLVSLSVFMALSTVFHSINSPDNSLHSHCVLLVLFCLIGPFNYIYLYESLPQPWYNPLCLTGLKAPRK